MWFRSVYLKTLRDFRIAILGWGAGMGLLIALLAFAGGKSVSADFGLGDALLFGMNVALICGVFGSIALLLSQFTQERRTASGLTGGLLLVFIVLDMVHRVIPGTEWLSRLSPVYYYNLSKALIPAYGVNPGGMLVLLALSILLSGAALGFFARRDVGGTVALPRWLRLPERAVGAAGGCHRLSALRLAARGGGHRPLELFAGDLVLHHLCWSRVELVGCDVAAVRLLLLWYAAAAWSAPREYAGRPGCRHRGAGAGLSTLCAQGHWAIKHSAVPLDGNGSWVRAGASAKVRLIPVVVITRP